MGSLLLPLPVLAVVLAALEVLLLSLAEPWRSGDVRLFFHVYYLWACFGLVALLPARWTLGVWERRAPRHAAPERVSARPWISLLGWMVLPVVGESTLDRHTSLVGLSGLLAAEPWLELGATLFGSAALLVLSGRWLGMFSGLRTASVGVTLALLGGLLLPGRRPAAAAQAPVARPNLLFLVWDTCRADKLEPYGHARPTSPHLAELARESIVYEDSLSVSSFTFTSHLSLLTGVHPVTHGAHLRDMRFDPARTSSIAALLEQQGYRTGAFVGTDVLAGHTGLRAGFEVYDDTVDPAVCDTFAWRFVHALQALAAEVFPALQRDGRSHWIQDFQRPGDEVLTRALAWIREDDPRPWFCFVNLYDVHWPYVPERAGRELVRPYDGLLDGYLFRSHRWQPEHVMTSADKQHVSDLYEGEIVDLDALVAGFLERLDLERGGTAVLVTADHGEGLGDGDGTGVWNHDDVRESQVRVPLLLRLPEVAPEGQRVRAPVSGVDVAPTLLGLAGVALPEGMEGRDLLRALPEAERERWIDDRDHLHPAEFRCALYRGGFKLVRFGTGATARFELYDLARDAGGFQDVQAQHPEMFTELLGRMQERLQAEALHGHGPDGDSAPALDALGYTGG